MDDNPGPTPDTGRAERRVAGAPTATAPPVTLLLVTHHPGAWFDETLDALAQLDYPALDLVVVDAASRELVADRVHATLPDARIVRLDENRGFGRSIDEARSRIDVAPLLVLAHDDIAPDPGAVRALVEEAFRSNAAVVGPKLVRWDDVRRLLAAGEGADKFGFPVPTVERGELDQEQHDAVRDVFNVPDAFTLVRTDLLDAIGGFDPEVSWFGDDLDLCWRAHVAGGRVLVAPAARVRHLEALGERRPVDDRRRLQFRHRLRVMLGAYGRLSVLRIVPQLLVVHLVEVLFSLVTGRPGHARDVVTAWTWNLARLGSLRRRRAVLHTVRQVPDSEVRSLQVGGSARIAAFLHGQLGVGTDPLGSAATLGRRMVDTVAGPGRRAALVAWIAVFLVLAFGTRHLLTRPIPVIGELLPFPEQIGPIVSEWASSWRRAGTGSEGFAATADLLLGFGTAASVGAAGLLRTVLILGMLPLGLVGVWRLVAPAHSVRASIVGLFTYLAVPLGFDSIATGSWRGLLGYGVLPWVVARLLRASGQAPFGAADPPAGPRVDIPPLWRQALVLGVLIALPAAVDPLWIVLPLVLVVAMVPGSLVAGRPRGLVRMALAALGAGIVAAALHATWLVTLLGGDVRWSTFTGGRVEESPHVPVLELLRFDTGPIGSPLTAAVLLAAAYVLLVGRDWRLGWAARAWSMALVSWGALWASGMGWLPVALPRTELVLAPAGVAMALAAGLGAAAFELDVRRRKFSWRQFASLVAMASLAVAVLPVLGAAVGGRWLMPRFDHAEALSFLDAEAAEDQLRVVWIGHPDVIPITGWPLVDGAAYATTLDGTPVAQDLWPGNPEPSDAPLRRSLDLALDGDTSRLGRILAPMGIRYVVLVEQSAPAPYGGTARPVPPRLSAALDAQLDLVRVDVNQALTVYRNAAWAPLVSAVPSGVIPTSSGEVVPEGARQAAALDLGGVASGLDGRGLGTAAGSVPADHEVVVGSTPADGWSVEVDGAAVESRAAFGWARTSAVGSGGEVRVAWSTPTVHRLALVGQVLVALVVAVVMYLTRLERRELRRATGPSRREARGGAPPDRTVARSERRARTGRRSVAREPVAVPEAEPSTGERRRRRR